jgi:hypothetical protein
MGWEGQSGPSSRPAHLALVWALTWALVLSSFSNIRSVTHRAENLAEEKSRASVIDLAWPTILAASTPSDFRRRRIARPTATSVRRPPNEMHSAVPWFTSARPRIDSARPCRHKQCTSCGRNGRNAKARPAAARHRALECALRVDNDQAAVRRSPLPDWRGAWSVAERRRAESGNARLRIGS